MKPTLTTYRVAYDPEAETWDVISLIDDEIQYSFDTEEEAVEAARDQEQEDQLSDLREMIEAELESCEDVNRLLAALKALRAR